MKKHVIGTHHPNLAYRTSQSIFVQFFGFPKCLTAVFFPMQVGSYWKIFVEYLGISKRLKKQEIYTSIK